MPDLPALIAARHRQVLDSGTRLVLALPNLIHRRRGALDLCSHKLTGGLRQAIGGVHLRAGRVLARLTDAPLRASPAGADAPGSAAPAHGLSLSLRWPS